MEYNKPKKVQRLKASPDLNKKISTKSKQSKGTVFSKNGTEIYRISENHLTDLSNA